MEVDFAGKTFEMLDKLTGEITDIVVFVVVLPYSQRIYAEGMSSTKESQWIQVNNNALRFYGGVPAIVVCDNCKQAVVSNKDWIHPTLNIDYADWAEHNSTAIVPAKVRKPKFLLHTIVNESEVKMLLTVLEARCESEKNTIVCSQREPKSWASMLLNDEVSANAIIKRATKHYTAVINVKER